MSTSMADKSVETSVELEGGSEVALGSSSLLDESIASSMAHGEATIHIELR